MAKFGPLLTQALEKIDGSPPAELGLQLAGLAARVSTTAAFGEIPLILKAKRQRPKQGESWAHYKERIAAALAPMGEMLTDGRAVPLFLANALAASFPVNQVRGMAEFAGIETIELDPVVNPTMMDDTVIDLSLSDFRINNGPLTGEGIRVAVLDSGIDTQHPYLQVAESVSTCDEDIAIPGLHGTHCAGSIASKDTLFPGVAPDVTLLNVKVLRANGNGSFSSIVKGVDAALDMDAHLMSMSLGFNHLPTWSNNGHGWACAKGDCPLCTSVDNAYMLGVLSCVAAGNEHGRAESLRRFGYGDRFDTELGCPGQARRAITVGAVTKRTFLTAEFSSRGPTAYGDIKPDLVGPGVNIMSTIPAPRSSDGSVVANPAPADLFGRESGTSMATAIVSGSLALLIQARQNRGLSTRPAALRKSLVEDATVPVSLPSTVVGAGRVVLGHYKTPSS